MALNIITAPSVYLVGRQQVNVPELDRFLADQGVPGFQSDATKAGEELIEVAGRLCYESFRKPRPGGNEKYIGHILEVGHGSVLEAEVFNVIVTGISRSLSHELVRHRVGISPSQLSQRYVDESDVAFVVPPALMSEVLAAKEEWDASWGSPSYDADETDCMLAGRVGIDEVIPGIYWIRSCAASLAEYSLLVNYLASRPGRITDQTAARKQAREAARSVLPNCTETKIFLTGNARAWRGMLDQRATLDADAEFCRLAVVIFHVLRKESPHVFYDYSVQVSESGREYLIGKHRKV